MTETYEKILANLRLVWRRRWLLLIVASLVCVIGWPVVHILPNKFAVTAKVYIDTQSMLRPLLEGLAVDSNVTVETAQVLRQTLLNRPTLEKVARETDLDILAKTPQELERILTDLAKDVRISGNPNDHIYEITYTNSDAKLATNVVEELLTIFVEGALGASRRDTSSTQRFLDSQINDYETKLIEAEDRLKDFKRENIGLMPSEGRNYFARLNSSVERLRAAQLEYSELKNRESEINRRIAELKAAYADPSKRGTMGDSPLDERLATLRERLDDLQFRYTDNHPDVVSTKRIIADLEKKRDEDLATMTAAEEVQLLEANPVYQELQIALGQVEADMAGMEVRVKQYQREVEELQQLVDTIPQIEAELVKLNRDYDVIRDNYEGLVRRRESARISYDAERTSDEVQFNVIQPPVEPLVPISPNRPILITAVLMAGFGAGVGLILLLSQLRPTYLTLKEFSEDSSIPVFGGVSMVLTEAQLNKARYQIVSFGAGASLLILLYLGLMVLQFI